MAELKFPDEYQLKRPSGYYLVPFPNDLEEAVTLVTT